MTDVTKEEAIAWAEKVAASKPPRYTDASRNAARYILTHAAQIEVLRSVVERAQQIISHETYVNWHEAARAALGEPTEGDQHGTK